MAAEDAGELAAWLRLLASPGLGRQQLRQILAELGSLEALYSAPRDEWQRRFGPAVAEALDVQPQALGAEVDRALAWCAEPGLRGWLAIGDARYPDSLLQTADPPLLLFFQGRVELLKQRAIAIVGSRNPTAQGADNARAFAEHLARAGYTIVSGMALGIDAAAHVGALSGGTTIAVVGTGLDRVYPRANRELAHRIAESGLLMSEFPLGTPPLQQNFPQRNRIIAGLSAGTLVVEAALQSGSLITAAQAVEAGREVFAIPGSVHSPQSRGCHALIKQGAKLVETAQDVLDELEGLFPTPRPQQDRAGPTGRDPLLDALGYEPADLDTLLQRTGLPAGTLNARLLELELEGHVARLPGGLYQRRATG
jgi:DNA processing protein